MTQRFFINRRTGDDRRHGRDQRKNPRLDLSHKRRRKQQDRRSADRNISDDFYASNNFFVRKGFGKFDNKH